MINIYNIKLVFISFVFYSIVGWIIEVIDQFYRQKKIINRGFLLGPYCPVHGIGALLMLLLLSRFSNNSFILFISSVLICTILEYLTGFLLEKIFKARWWDYSDYKFNLNGRVCLQNSLFFGLAGVIIVKFSQPFLISVISNISANMLNIICIIILIIFCFDLIVSFYVICSFKNLTNNMLKDSTVEISNKVKAKLAKQSVLFKRLIMAFPNLKRGVIRIKNNIVSFFTLVIK
ncbi:MAG: putative ABC transporter permease [Bacilli bacterium]|nr:putative ABC transporter permease [Bacilli bacterium]